ncbi:hypothetical protein C8R45DRAFT_946501 [Mycena sanguinolenta]|nr:hypothetical protein C8R45DRAFT_946501 [Mycena sanguinolenta]
MFGDAAQINPNRNEHRYDRKAQILTIVWCRQKIGVSAGSGRLTRDWKTSEIPLEVPLAVTSSHRPRRSYNARDVQSYVEIRSLQAQPRTAHKGLPSAMVIQSLDWLPSSKWAYWPGSQSIDFEVAEMCEYLIFAAKLIRCEPTARDSLLVSQNKSRELGVAKKTGYGWQETKRRSSDWLRATRRTIKQAVKSPRACKKHASIDLPYEAQHIFDLASKGELKGRILELNLAS